MPHYRHAFVRAPSSSFRRALGQRPGGEAIDVDRAKAQHRLYVDALRFAGLRVTELEPASGLPDACFVQDVAMLLPEISILARPAEPSRREEVDLLRPHLPGDRPVVDLRAPATLEWGDVLRIGSTLYVGMSARTNAQGLEQLGEIVEPLGLVVEALAVRQGLHLLSGLVCLGRPSARGDGPDVMLAWPTYASLPMFQDLDIIEVPAEELPAANCLALGDTVLLPVGYPQTAAAIWQRGFQVLTVPIGEFAKAAGGVTCLSLLAP